MKINIISLIYSLIFCIYLLLNLKITMIYSKDVNLELYTSYLLQYIMALSTFIFFSITNITTKSAFDFLDAWVLIGCFASILAIIQSISGQLIIDDFLFIPYYEGNIISYKEISGVLAATAWFSESSWLGSFLTTPFIYSLVKVLNKKDSSLKTSKQYLLSFLLLLSGMIACYSMTAISSVLFGLLIFILISNKKYKLISSIIIIFSGLLLYSLSDTKLVTLNLNRFGEIINNIVNFEPGNMSFGTTTSFYVRSVGFYDGLTNFINNPTFGIGLGQAKIPYHSGLITLLAELGIIGAALFYTPFFIAIKKLVQLKNKNIVPQEKTLIVIFIVSLSADILNGFITHNSFHLQRWLLISFITSWLVHHKEPNLTRKATIPHV